MVSAAARRSTRTLACDEHSHPHFGSNRVRRWTDYGIPQGNVANLASHFSGSGSLGCSNRIRRPSSCAVFWRLGRLGVDNLYVLLLNRIFRLGCMRRITSPCGSNASQANPSLQSGPAASGRPLSLDVDMAFFVNGDELVLPTVRGERIAMLDCPIGNAAGPS